MTNNISFTGFHYAQCKGLTQKGKSCIIDFYRVTKNDKKLIESISKIDQNDLGTPIRMATGCAKKAPETNDVFVAVSGNKPIGISASTKYVDEDNNQPYYYIHAIATWGKDKGFFSKDRKNKVLNAGKGLMNVIFKTAQSNNIDKIKLVSINESTPFYRQNGFGAEKSKIKGKYFLLTAKEMNCDLSPELVDKNFKDIGFRLINSDKEVSLEELDTSLSSSGLHDFLNNKLNSIKNLLHKPL